MSPRGRRPDPSVEHTEKLTVSIPIRLRQALRDAAAADTRTVSNFITKLLAKVLAPDSSTQTPPTRNASQESNEP